MADLPTLEAAMKLADQDSPLPSLAGPALKRLRDAVNGLSIYDEAMQDAMLRIMRTLGIVGAKPAEVATVLENRLADRAATQADKGDSTTLTALIAELRAREAVGRAKYGTDVDRTDLNNAQWRQHLREELMDALLYSLAEERTVPVNMCDAQWTAAEIEEIKKGGTGTVYGIDKGTDDKTVEAFGHIDNSQNSGHGHVRPRPDGLVAKCGGPNLCRLCAQELAQMMEIPSGKDC